MATDPATDPAAAAAATPARLATSFASWRRFHLGAEEVQARLAAASALLAAGRHEEAFAQAEALLEHAPFDGPLLLWLVRAAAARGDAASHGKHLSTAFYVDVLDGESVHADPSLRGALSKKAFDANVRATREVIGKDRSRDYYFTEVEPRQDDFCTRLCWSRADGEQVLAALRRFCADTSRVDRVRDPKSKWHDDYLWWIETRVGEGTELVLEGETSPGFCHLGRLVVLLQELAPFVDDVRLFLFDQTCPLYEVWIVEHAFYVRRHPIYAQDEMWEHLDTSMQDAGIRDAPLEALLLEHFEREAAGWLEGGESSYMDAAECKQKAEALLARAARLGSGVSLAHVEKARLEGDEAGALDLLERLVQQQPANEKARLELIDTHLAGGRFAAALALLDGLDSPQLHRRAIALQGTGAIDEASAAYDAHAAAIVGHSSGVLLRQAHELFDRGWTESARRFYAVLAKTKDYATPLEAELGLALCAQRRGDADGAEAHYRRVLAAAPAQKAKCKPIPSAAAAIEHCEHVAVRWRDAVPARRAAVERSAS